MTTGEDYDKCSDRDTPLGNNFIHQLFWYKSEANKNK